MYAVHYFCYSWAVFDISCTVSVSCPYRFTVPSKYENAEHFSVEKLDILTFQIYLVFFDDSTLLLVLVLLNYIISV